jgi:tetratricopeptide (TPR) repeat protein
VLFLEGLITADGEQALEMYQKVSRLYPTSPYADDALMKIGEYLYARGLYIQAAQYLQRIPIHYPRSDLLYPSIRLFLNAMTVSGNRDTALFYTQVFAKKYPQIEFDLEAGRAAGSKEDTTQLVSERPAGLPIPDAEVKDDEPERAPTSSAGRAYRLQAGAFGRRDNAERRKAILQSLNYKVRITPTRSSSGRLYLVMVEGFSSRAEAERAGTRLSDNYGIENFVVQQN